MEINFEYETKYGTYRDALYFPDDHPLPPEAEIKAMELERVNSWIAFIENPPMPPPTPETDEVHLEVTNG